MKQLLFLLLAFTLLCTSCKKWQHKYPEDTERTKLTPKERLTGKTWTLKNVTLNGKDYTDTVFQKFGKIQFSFFGSQVTQSLVTSYTGGVASENFNGFPIIWNFKDNDTRIGVSSINGAGNGSFVLVYCISFGNYLNSNPIILKLSTNEFKVSITSDSQDTTFTNLFTSN